MARAALIVTLAALWARHRALERQALPAGPVQGRRRGGEPLPRRRNGDGDTRDGDRRPQGPGQGGGGVFRVGFRVPAQGCGAAYAVRRVARAVRPPPRLRRPAGLRAPAPGLRRLALRRDHPVVTVRRMLVLALFVLLLLPVGATPSGGVRGGGVQGGGVQGGGVQGGGVQGTVKQATGGACLADDPCDGIGRNLGLVLLPRRPTGSPRAFQRQRRLPRTSRSRSLRGEHGGRAGQAGQSEPRDRARRGFVRVTLVVGDAGHRMSTPGR